MNIAEKRVSNREDNHQMVPQPVEGEPGFVRVDTTWGIIQPIEVASGVLTVDELKVNEYLKQGFPIIDARTANFYEESTIPGARSIPHDQVVERLDELINNILLNDVHKECLRQDNFLM